MIKAIVFDCFGVLAEDGWMPFKRKYIEADSEIARQITLIGDQTDLGALNHELMITEMSKLTGTDPEILRHAISMKIPNEELFEYIRKELKPKYKIGLITNGSYNVLSELFNPDQTVLFDATVVSYESHLKKPDPRAYQLAAERLGVQLNECLFIDDRERHIDGAQKAGASAILYTNLKDLINALKTVL